MLYLESTRLADISEIVKMVGILAGGLWAAWTFQKLQKTRAAELENTQTLNAIQKSRIEQDELRTRLLRQQPQLAMELHVTETPSTTSAYKSFLCIMVTLKNEGEQNLDVQFGLSPLAVGRMVFRKNGEQTIEVERFGASYFDDESEAPQLFRERILRVGQKRQMALAVLPVAEPAGYIIQFHALYGRRPFDNERSTEEPLLINAVEQAIYFANGEPNQTISPA